MRTEENCPDDVPHCTWVSGVSPEPLPGFMRNFASLCRHNPVGQSKRFFVHSSTTAGDAKHYIKQDSIPSPEAELFGTVSKEKVHWHKRLLEGSPHNWAPMEDRVFIPSSFRLRLFMVCFGVFERCVCSLVSDMTSIGMSYIAVFVLVACVCMSGRS